MLPVKPTGSTQWRSRLGCQGFGLPWLKPAEDAPLARARRCVFGWLASGGRAHGAEEVLLGP
jgi:hypothetical protein